MTKRDSITTASGAETASNLQPVSVLSRAGGATQITKAEDLPPEMVEDVTDFLLSTKPSLAAQITGALKQLAVPLPLCLGVIANYYWLEPFMDSDPFVVAPGVLMGHHIWLHWRINGRLAHLDFALAERGVTFKGRYRITRRLRRLFCANPIGPTQPEKETIRKALLGPAVSTGSSSADPVHDALSALSPLELASAVSTMPSAMNKLKWLYAVFGVFSLISGGALGLASTLAVAAWFEFETMNLGWFLSEYGYSKATGHAAENFVRKQLKKFRNENRFLSSSQMKSGEHLERFVSRLYSQEQLGLSSSADALPEIFREHGFEKDGVYEGIITGRYVIGLQVELAPGCIGFLPSSDLATSWQKDFAVRVGERIPVKILGPWIDGRPLLSRRAATHY